MPVVNQAWLDAVVGDSFLNKDASVCLSVSTDTSISNDNDHYDVFLSHSWLEKQTVLQINCWLEQIWGLKVFVDWVEMPELNRENVTPAMADKIREAMNHSTSLIYALSTSSPSAADDRIPRNSGYWELGYCGAVHNRTAILPIANGNEIDFGYQHQEFLSLYPHLEIYAGSVWVRDPQHYQKYIAFERWIQGHDPYIHS